MPKSFVISYCNASTDCESLRIFATGFTSLDHAKVYAHSQTGILSFEHQMPLFVGGIVENNLDETACTNPSFICDCSPTYYADGITVTRTKIVRGKI